MQTQLPTIALAMGDPAGVSPELTAKLLANDEVRAAAGERVFKCLYQHMDIRIGVCCVIEAELL